mmetsp:Transcript_3448/g.9343  ORF Transcript_3448/g.9343 Transcript_3448/m.9343 type:complete len:200 (-) Transcript_3448:71-670(-)
MTQTHTSKRQCFHSSGQFVCAVGGEDSVLLALEAVHPLHHLLLYLGVLHFHAGGGLAEDPGQLLLLPRRAVTSRRLAVGEIQRVGIAEPILGDTRGHALALALSASRELLPQIHFLEFPIVVGQSGRSDAVPRRLPLYSLPRLEYVVRLEQVQINPVPTFPLLMHHPPHLFLDPHHLPRLLVRQPHNRLVLFPPPVMRL